MNERPKAYYSDEHDCWFIPCSPELKRDFTRIELATVELKDGELWITPRTGATFDIPVAKGRG